MKGLAHRIHIVLCNPEDPRNVGGAIRAVANAGLGSVRIATKNPFDERDIFCYSSGALELSTVKFFDSVREAVADCHLIIGTSRRLRDPDSPPEWPASGLAQRLDDSSQTAILFGTERTGLIRPELELCSALVHIPTAENFPSMNLAHAVACISYELVRPPAGDVGPQIREEAPRLDGAARDAFYGFVTESLHTIGYPPGRNPTAFVKRLRKILHRANLNQQELSMFGGIFAELVRLNSGSIEAERQDGKKPVQLD